MEITSIGLRNQAAANNNPNNTAASQVSSTQFLELLVAQLQNQNPLEPMEGTEFVTQLAEFANLEQLTLVNSGIDNFANGQAHMSSNQTIDLVGRTVSYPGNNVTLLEGESVNVQYGLNSSAGNLAIAVIDQDGIRRGFIGDAPRKAGDNEFQWNGTVLDQGKTKRLPEGTYQFVYSAFDGTEAVPVMPYSVGKVTGISFKNNRPELIIGDQTISPNQINRVTE